MVSVVVACNRKKVIGRDGKLPWRLPQDMKLFKERTWGNVVVMGRKTWESLPKKPLPGRTNLVLTSQYLQIPEAFLIGPNACTVGVCDSLEGAIKTAGIVAPGKEVFIIGGAQVYESALKAGIVDRIFLSLVDDDSYQSGDVRWEGIMWGGLSMLNWRSEKLGDYEGFELWEHVRT